MLFGGFLVPKIGWKGAFLVFGLSGMVYACVAFVRMRRLDRFIDKVEERHNAIGSADDISMLSDDECNALDYSLTEEETATKRNKNGSLWTARTTPTDLADQLSSLRQTPTRSHAAHITTNIGFFTFQNWLGIYMQGSLGFSISDTGAYLFLPWFMTAIVAYFGETLPESHSRPPNAAVACETNRHDYRDHDPRFLAASSWRTSASPYPTPRYSSPKTSKSSPSLPSLSLSVPKPHQSPESTRIYKTTPLPAGSILGHHQHRRAYLAV